MSNPSFPGNHHETGQPHPPQQFPPQPPSPYAQHPPQQHPPQQHPPQQFPPQQFPPQPAPQPKSKALLWTLSSVAFVLVLAAIAGAVVFSSTGDRGGSPAQPSPAAPSSSDNGGQRPADGNDSSLAGKTGAELMPLMPTASDFPPNLVAETYLHKPGEANGDDRVKPPPPEATTPPSCWPTLEIRRNRDDIPEITRLVTTLGNSAANTKVTVVAAQIAKENGVDALEKAKDWLSRCPTYESSYQLKDGQPPTQFAAETLSGPPAFPDPFFGVKITESRKGRIVATRYFFAAHIRGLLVLSEGVCDKSSCDDTQSNQLAQQIRVMFSKTAQGLRNAS